MDIPDMTDEKSLGRQVSPHRGLRIGFLFLILDGIIDMRQFIYCHTTLMMQRDIRQPHILHRIAWQTRNATPHRTSMTYLDIVEMNALDTADMIHRNNLLHILTIRQIAPSAIAKTNEDGRLRTLDSHI